MTIGWCNRDYATLRAIPDKVMGIEYVRSRSYASVISRIARMVGLPRKRILKFGATFIGGTKSNKVDLFHFFNQIGVGWCRHPFVTSFETSVPRFLNRGDYWWAKSVEAMASSRCKRLIALSECSLNIQLHIEGVPDVSDRITVLHPPQEVLIDIEALKRKTERQGALKFFFVGRDFFRKGGGESLRALARIRKDFPVEVWTVGDFEHVDYASSWTVDSREATARLIEANKDWIHYAHSLPNGRVLELMKTCDVGLLPTRADTYGYSVLEMQACGLPVITTDVRALPEINDDKCGWLIKGCGVRDGTRRYGEADYSTAEKLRELSERIENGVYNACLEIAAKPNLIAERGGRAFVRIKREHDPVQYGLRLGEIYREAIG